MMNQQEALKQIQEISKVIEASNHLLMSGTLAITYGFGVILIPFIEYFTDELTFGLNWGAYHLIVVTVFHILFYIGLFFVLRLIVEKLWPSDKLEPNHPILNHAVAFHRPVVTAAAALTLLLGSIGLQRLIPAVVLILIGILFNIYGRLSHKIVRFFSWTYIFLGFVLGVLNRNDFTKLWYGFSVYLGLSFIVMGFQFKKQKHKETLG